MGTLILPQSGLIYLDANPIIYAVEKIEPYCSFLNPLWLAARAEKLTLVTSELTWLETMTKPIKDGNKTLESLFRAFLASEELNLIPANLTIWEKATHRELNETPSNRPHFKPSPPRPPLP